MTCFLSQGALFSGHSCIRRETVATLGSSASSWHVADTNELNHGRHAGLLPQKSIYKDCSVKQTHRRGRAISVLFDVWKKLRTERSCS